MDLYVEPAMNARVAEELAGHLRDAGFNRAEGQVLMLVEEAGEFAAAYRRWTGMARRSGTFDDVSAELADVVIGAWVVADFLNVDLNTAIRDKLQVIFSRGWRESAT